ncbi:inactive protein RESTRICTED TEV MOVEMENT 2-like [Senna tora]|uniref:Inactive protein RESTRICTED TEV MOVEMENT 2-like n=1 Tax=Senna tora TaxID=362788 RepID=A0A834T579_9FABA|nr:inactive protein RESTRICTED TEV MOVEMENT 2-like [Senna tora]
MDTKQQILSEASNRVYEDYEPDSHWERNETTATLIVQLPGFRRQDFKIVYTSVLSISGERMISEKKWLRFSKEISIPSDCDTKNNIMAAKFLNGVLHITFQRLISDPEPQEITKMTPSEKKEEAPRPQKEPIIKPQLPKEDSQKEMTQYEDFEPHFEWSRDAKNATLLVKLPGFSKEHLKNIEFTSVLSISGEREITETKRLRFNKQISIPSDCDSDKMRAKLQNGVLSVTFPLLPTPPTEPQEITKMPPAEESPSDAKATEKENDSVIKTTERKEEKEVITKASLPEDASRRAPAKAEPEEKKKAPKDPRLQVGVSKGLVQFDLV